MSAPIRLDVYSHNFSVIPRDMNSKVSAYEYARRMTEYELQWQGGRYPVRVPVRCYAVADKARTYFRFHRNQLDDFINYMAKEGYNRESFERVDHQPQPGVPIQLTLKPGWAPREHQVPVVEYLAKEQPCHVLPLQTGMGKTFCALYGAYKYGRRFELMIPAQYLEKWEADLTKHFELEDKDVLVIQGGKALIRAMEMAVNNEIPTLKALLISSNTYRNYLSECEASANGRSIYPFAPHEWNDRMQTGLRITDEVHENFHLNYRIEMYANLATTYNLSATIVTSVPVVKKMYDIIYPKSCWPEGMEYNRYTDLYAYAYAISNPDKLKHTVRGRKSYNHVEFEKSILKNKAYLEQYLELVEWVFNEDFLQHQKSGQRALIFAASIEMCGKIKAFLKRRHPRLDIERYVGEDSFTVLEKAEIIVSTLQSAGTAVDIDDLMYVLNTVSSNSEKQNLQSFGRIRKPKKWLEQTPRYSYTYCRGIRKQAEYHDNKLVLFNNKATKIVVRDLGIRLNTGDRPHWQHRGAVL